jgi:hypothetical protein
MKSRRTWTALTRDAEQEEIVAAVEGGARHGSDGLLTGLEVLQQPIVLPKRRNASTKP